MSDILSLWKRIAAGNLPEGVTVEVTDGTIKVDTPRIYIRFEEDDYPQDHRSALMLLVDAWEKEGHVDFYREKYVLDKQWTAHQGQSEPIKHRHRDEHIALATVLADLGERVKPGEAGEP